MILGIVKGLAFIFLCHFIISFFNPNKNPRFAMQHSVISMLGFIGGVLLLPLISILFFPLWFTLLCYAIFLTANFGVDPNAPAISMSSFQRNYGMMFNNIGLVLYVAAFALFIYQTFFA